MRIIIIISNTKKKLYDFSFPFPKVSLQFSFSRQSCFNSATYSTFIFSDDGDSDGGVVERIVHTNAVFMLSSLLLFLLMPF